LLLLPFAVLWNATPAGSMERPVLILTSVVLMIVNPATFYRLWSIGQLTSGTRVFCSPAQVIAILSVQCYALVGLFVMSVRRGAVAEPATAAKPMIQRMERKAAA
jgi:hypothetical protein